MSDAARAVLALLGERAAGTTICPSEAARRLAADAGDADWRGWMPDVHAAVDRLLAGRTVQLSWRGERLAARDGPYRIARAGRP